MTDRSPRHGTFGWTQLLTADPDGASAFYQALLGWRAEASELEGVAQQVMYLGEEPVASIVGVPGDAGEAMPHWHPHLNVDDVDASVALAEELGGRVIVAPGDIAGLGRLAVIQDPSGAVLTLVGIAAGDAGTVEPEPGAVADAVDVDGD